MSKAFTRESDDTADEPILPPVRPPLPPGVKNYITPDGVRRLQAELDELVQVERPRLIAASQEGESKRDLQLLDQRIASLDESLRTAVVVEPPAGPEPTVRFGATVTVRDRAGASSIYRIVGVDETDVDRGWISWRSPLARALLNASAGKRVRFKLPAGEEQLEIVEVHYGVPVS